MKKLITGLAVAAATMTAVVAIPAAANAQPYGYHHGYHRGYYHHPRARVCSFRHHHRVCYFR